MIDRAVRTYAGVPPVAVFASSAGTPLVVNTLTGVVYYLDPVTGLVTATGSATPATAATIDTFTYSYFGGL